jgi:rhodanese-related sulfurtransferase
MEGPTVVVMSRERAEHTRPGAGSVCISITERHHSDAKLAGWADILRLKFDDIECEGGDYLPLSSEQAREILEFAHGHRDRTITPHCQFGYSRSVAVGVFLSAWLNRPLSADLSHPNTWVIARLCAVGLRMAIRWRDLRLLAVCLVGPMWFARKNQVSLQN